MPILEIVLFGAGITIGGQRAWQRLKEDLGLTQRNENVELPIESDTPAAAPLSARSFTSERRGFRDFLEDVEHLVSPRPRSGKVETAESEANSLDNHAVAAMSRNSPPPSPEGSPRPSTSMNGVEENIRDDPNLGSMWIASAINRLTAKLSPRNNHVEIASPEPKEKVAKAVRALAGENVRYVNRANEVRRAASCDWSPKSTPRQSALKKLAGDSSPASTPRGGRRRIKWNEEVNVRNFLETSEELQSRREHWARILRNAEREACAAYVSNGHSDSEYREEEAARASHAVYSREPRECAARVDDSYKADGAAAAAAAAPHGMAPWSLFPQSPPSPPAAGSCRSPSPPRSPSPSSPRPPIVPKLNLSSVTSPPPAKGPAPVAGPSPLESPTMSRGGPRGR